MDVMRALAVLLMLQGHTIHALLASEFRSMDSVLYSYWYAFRGYTAPIFMFTAGTVFSYLLFKSGAIELKNRRVRKGIRRALILLGIGYFLRFPTFKISQLAHITEEQWNIFFAVDALQLIAFGLLIIISVSILAQKIKVNSLIVLLFMTLVIFGSAGFVKSVEWINILPVVFASYLSDSYGSLFPLFPWLGYMFAGACFGLLLSRKDEIAKPKLALYVLLAACLLILLSFLLQLVNYSFFEASAKWLSSFSFSLWRLSIVLLINTVVIIGVSKIRELPGIVQLYGKHSLMIYVVHLIIIYGSAVIAGLTYVYGQSLTLLECLLVFVIMNIAIIGMCLLIEIIKNNKLSIATYINSIYRKIIPGVK